MYEKILAQLAAKHPGVSKVVLGLIAKKLAEKATEESQIEGVIDEFETNSPLTVKEIADFHQAESDKRVTEAVKKAKGETGKPPKPSKGDDEEEQQDQVPAWAKGLQETVNNLQKELAGAKTKNTLNDLVTAAKAKGIPEKFAQKYQIGEDFEVDKALTELETEWTEMKQIAVNTSLDNGKVVAGVAASGKDVSAAIKNFAKTNVVAATEKKSV